MKPLYEFTDADVCEGKAGIYIEQMDHGWALDFSGESYFESEEDAKSARQEYATAIADWMVADAVKRCREEIAAELLKLADTYQWQEVSGSSALREAAAKVRSK